jgi:GDP-L-fucose synthase
MKIEGKKILVTGGSGMIGRYLVDLLLEEGASEITIASLDEVSDLPENVKYKIVDLRHFDKCISLCQGQDIVFNLVGVKGSPKMCAEQPADFMVPMLQFNTNMMEAARLADVEWYLFTSSVGVYKPAEVFYEEDVWSTFPSPNDRFAGWAKRIGELQAEAYKIQYDWDRVSIVRPANVYGAYDNFSPENAMVIPSLIRKADENDIMSVWGDGSPVRDFIHAKDVARGMVHMVKNQITKPVNLGSGTGISIKEVADTVSKIFDKPIAWDVDKPSGDKIRLMSTSLAEEVGFTTIITLEEGIKETADWYLENKEIINQRYNVFLTE